MASDTSGNRTDRQAANLLGGRLPLLRPDELNSAQHVLFDRLVRTRTSEASRSGFTAQLPDGRFIGPFNTFLHAPEIASVLNDWADAIAVHSGLLPDVRQVVILTVGSAWQAGFEVYAHTAAARRVGVPDHAVEAIVAGRPPTGLTPEADIAHRFANALVTTHVVSDALYAEIVEIFGVARVFAIVNLMGQYLTVAGLLNTFQVPVPHD